MKKKVLVSVIIPVYETGKQIKRCLDSVLKTDFSNLEVVVMDDGTNQEDKKILSFYKKDKRVRVIDLRVNRGPARARNRGVKESGGEYIFFLDADTKVKKDVLKKGVEFLKKNKKVGAVQARLLRKNGKMDTAGHFLSFLGFPYEIGVGEEKEKHSEERVILGARSAGMMVKRKVFEKTGGFDRDYLIYGEETDLCWRIWLLGYEIYYVPEMVVWHFGKSSMNPKTQVRVAYEGAKNNLNYLLKNSPDKVLWWIIPGHVLGWLVLSLKFLIQGRWEMVWGVIRGLFWNLSNIFNTWRKRKSVKRKEDLGKFVFGNLGWRNFLVKGFFWCKNV
jgi:GT2 family glycosyltransferase